MTSSWSSHLAAKYQVSFPADVTNWYDEEHWQYGTPLRFSEPISPEALLEAGSGVVLGGLMLPDTLPILGNGGGDALCLRFGRDGKLSEVVCWWHEGAYWSPYGKTFAEALLFDAAMYLAEDSEPQDLAVDSEYQRLVRWALNWTGVQPSEQDVVVRAFGQTSSELLDTLLAANIAQIPIHTECCRSLATSRLLNFCLTLGGQTLADKLGVEWTEFSAWIFDTALVPDDAKNALADATDCPLDELLSQNWDAAEKEAETVVAMRSDITWPFAVLGWSAERNGDLTTATQWYHRGLRSLATTADFTDSWSPKGAVNTTKFVAERLLDNSASLTSELQNDEYYHAIRDCHTSLDLSDSIREYWRDSGQTAERESRPFDAYRNYYYAGWDVHVFDNIHTLLENMIRNARSAESVSLATLAEYHLSNAI